MSFWNSGRAHDKSCMFGFLVTLTPAATAPASTVEQAFTITGVPGLPLVAGDIVNVTGPGSGNALGIAGARINSSGQLAIAFSNPTAGSLTYASGVFSIKIARL